MSDASGTASWLINKVHQPSVENSEIPNQKVLSPGLQESEIQPSIFEENPRQNLQNSIQNSERMMVPKHVLQLPKIFKNVKIKKARGTRNGAKYETQGKQDPQNIVRKSTKKRTQSPFEDIQKFKRTASNFTKDLGKNNVNLFLYHIVHGEGDKYQF